MQSHVHCFNMHDRQNVESTQVHQWRMDKENVRHTCIHPELLFHIKEEEMLPFSTTWLDWRTLWLIR